MRPTRFTLVIATLLAAAVAMPAQGQSKPEPGCFPLFADKKGDAGGDASLDITGWWFSHAGGKTFATMRIDNLSASLPSDATGVSWYMLWSVGDSQHFVTASIEVGQLEPAFGYGTVEETPNGTLRQQAGDTPGQFIEGPDGIIQLEIPADVGGGTGTDLKAPLADTAKLVGVPGVVSSIQTADTAAGKAWKVGPCGGAAPANNTPSTAPPSGPAQSAGTPGSGPAKGKLDVKVSTKVPRAKKVKKSLSLSATSSKGISGVDVVLYAGKAGGKIVGKGKVAKLAKKGKVKVKISKKIKKGKYVLYLVGKNSDGTSADKQFNLKFK